MAADREVASNLSSNDTLLVMKLYRSRHGFVGEHADAYFASMSLPGMTWLPAKIFRDYLDSGLRNSTRATSSAPRTFFPQSAARRSGRPGVTYYRSRDARMEESKSAGGGDFYDRVYSAAASGIVLQVIAPSGGGTWGESCDSRAMLPWSVPEPELALFITPAGKIAGYTIGNDMSSRDIEGENPLYLPQAKVYDRSCALWPMPAHF